MDAPPPKKSLARSLGEFLGHIWHGVKSDPSGAERKVVRHEVEEQQEQTADGRVTLRRTTIEEIEIRKNV